MPRSLDKICEVLDCKRKTFYPVCKYHTNRIRTGKDPEGYGIKHNPKCALETCTTPTVTKKDPYCRNHSDHARNGRDLTDIRPKKKSTTYQKNKGKTCKREGCGEISAAKGVCMKHYYQLRNPPVTKTCSIEGCDSGVRPPRSECVTHREQIRVHGRAWIGEKPYELTKGYRDSLLESCEVEGCSRLQTRRDRKLCQNHRNTALKKAGSEEYYLELLSITHCQMCGTENPDLVTDHDHACCPPGRACENCIRGRICSGCNTVLGHSRDDIQTLKKAIEYLENWNTLK